jgi:propanediol dehydratase small subunit
LTIAAMYGDEHPFTLSASANLASDLYTIGEPVAARALDEDILEVSRRVRGEEHPNTLATAANLSLDRRAVNDPGAEDLLADTLRLYNETLSLDHPMARAAEGRARINFDIEPF